MTVNSPPGRSPVQPRRTAGTPARHGPRNHLPWRAGAIGLTSLATPVGAGVADPLFGQIVAAIEVTVILVIIGTVLFGSQAHCDRAFRLLRWAGNRPEPPAPPGA